MKKVIKRFSPTARAIAQLLHPFAEVVIHDIASNKIAAIFNPISKREVGDEAYLSDEDMPDDCVGPYSKMNWDGRPLKSVSSIIRDDKEKAVALLCINLDVSQLQQWQQILSGFLSNEQVDQPAALFKEDWHERINQYVQQYLSEHHLSLQSIKRDEKKSLVKHLHDCGAFAGKNSANYIANVLDISRATVYKYLQG